MSINWKKRKKKLMCVLNPHHTRDLLYALVQAYERLTDNKMYWYTPTEVKPACVLGDCMNKSEVYLLTRQGHRLPYCGDCLEEHVKAEQAVKDAL